jgi:hypothetical protein
VSTVTDTAIMTGPYLVVCAHQGEPAHAWCIEADTADIAAAIARYRYQNVTGVVWPETIRVTAYAELPEIMFGDDTK